jgi:hypothetical protein
MATARSRVVHLTEVAPPEPHGPRTSLGGGVVQPVGARIDWASLLRRVYLEDVLACPCGGRRREQHRQVLRQSSRA